MKIKRKSAGLLIYRRINAQVEFFLVHHGGPFWAHKDEGAWSIPKGEYTEEEPLAAAIRELKEETGHVVTGPFIPLSPVVQKAGKEVQAWAVEANIDAGNIQSNAVKIQWPPHSGKWQSFPEVDKAAWFTAAPARQKINQAQIPFIDELIQIIDASS